MNEHTVKMILSMVNEFLIPMAEKYVEQTKNPYDDLALQFIKGGLEKTLNFLDKEGNKENGAGNQN